MRKTRRPKTPKIDPLEWARAHELADEHSAQVLIDQLSAELETLEHKCLDEKAKLDSLTRQREDLRCHLGEIEAAISRVYHTDGSWAPPTLWQRLTIQRSFTADAAARLVTLQQARDAARQQSKDLDKQFHQVGLVASHLRSRVKATRSTRGLARRAKSSFARIARHVETRVRLAGYEGRTRGVAVGVRVKLARDHQCPYCDGALGATPRADHIIPVRLGGLSTFENMVMVCNTCNSKKRDMTLQEFIRKYDLDRHAIETALLALGKRF